MNIRIARGPIMAWLLEKPTRALTDLAAVWSCKLSICGSRHGHLPWRSTGAIVQSGWGVIHLSRVRAEKTRIVDAVWMFIQEDPGIGRAGCRTVKIWCSVDRCYRTAHLRIAGADADVS